MSAGAAWAPFAPSAIAGSQLNICIVRLQGGCSVAEGVFQPSLVKSKHVKSSQDLSCSCETGWISKFLIAFSLRLKPSQKCQVKP